MLLMLVCCFILQTPSIDKLPIEKKRKLQGYVLMGFTSESQEEDIQNLCPSKPVPRENEETVQFTEQILNGEEKLWL